MSLIMKYVEEINDLKAQRRMLNDVIANAVKLFEDAHKDEAYNLLKKYTKKG